MIKRLVRAINAFPKKFGEAWVPCMLAMTQGDLSVVTWKHVTVAYTVGIRTAIFYSFCVLLLGTIKPAQSIVLTGFLTFIADLATHPTHFGPFWLEALVTGLGASAMCFAVEKIRIKLNRNSRYKHEIE